DDDPNAATLGSSFVRKPLYSREGANVALVTALSLWNKKAHMAPKVLFARRWRHCQTFPANIQLLEAGLSIMRRVDCRSARMKIRSPATVRGSCRTPFSEPRLACRHCSQRPRQKALGVRAYRSLGVRTVEPAPVQIRFEGFGYADHGFSGT